MNDSPARKIEGKVDLYKLGQTVLNGPMVPIYESTFLPTDNLQEIVISRLGENGKFFGFGICQQATIKIIEKENKLYLSNKHFEISFRANAQENSSYTLIGPKFYIKNVERDETSNVITITAYDLLDKATNYTFNDLGLVAPYTIKNVAENIATKLGISNVEIIDDSLLNIRELMNVSYENGANFGGDENLRVVLNAIAEATGTVYYLNNNNNLVFKHLTNFYSDKSVLDIDKKDYFDLTSGKEVRLEQIIHTTELGDTVVVPENGDNPQYIRDNPFWNMREDIRQLMNKVFTINQSATLVSYDLKWRGNFLTEIGDRISIECKDGTTIKTSLLNDTLTYNGGFNQTASWEYLIAEKETVANPVTIGEKINQTYARVDKVNKRIDLVSQDIDANKSEIASLKLTTDDIILRVEKVEKQEIEIDLDLTNDTNFIALTERVGQLEISDTNITASISNVETTLRGEINSTATDLNNTLKQEIADGDSALNNEIVAVKQNITSLELEADNITASVTALETKTSTDLSTAVSNLETVISNNNTELTNTLRAEIEAGDGEIITEVNTVKSELGELKVSTDAITLRVKDLEETTIDLDTDESFIALTNRVGALEVSDTQINASISNTETIVKKYTDDAITGVESDLSTLEDTLRGELTAGDEALGGEITTIKQDISSLSVRAGVIEASVSSVESSVTTKIDTAVDDLETSIGNLESSLQEEIETGDSALDEKITVVKSDISTLQIESSGINASVKSLESKTTDSIDALSNTVSALSKEVKLKMDSDAVNISINKALSEGVDKVKTSSKNYTFDDKGLNISSSDSEFNTTVDENGMRIYNYNTEVLTVNNQGVKAADLHARTFLIIGENSRLEDRGRRTACFWIGPAEE
jgi:predicted  nucleic acid-binding Zn-ribbon protein